MGEACLAPSFITRTNSIPHLDCHHWRLVVFKEDNLKPVSQGCFVDLISSFSSPKETETKEKIASKTDKYIIENIDRVFLIINVPLIEPPVFSS